MRTTVFIFGPHIMLINYIYNFSPLPLLYFISVRVSCSNSKPSRITKISIPGVTE